MTYVYSSKSQVPGDYLVAGPGVSAGFDFDMNALWVTNGLNYSGTPSTSAYVWSSHKSDLHLGYWAIYFDDVPNPSQGGYVGYASSSAAASQIVDAMNAYPGDRPEV